MNKRALVAALGVAGVASLSTGPAGAVVDYIVHGTQCVPQNIGNASGKYNQWGIRNDSLSVLTVECPIDRSYDILQPETNGGWVHVYDRNASAQLKVWLCDVSADGNGGACLQNQTTASFVGDTVLDFIPNWASNPYLRIVAELPAYTTQYGYSHVTTMRVRQL